MSVQHPDDLLAAFALDALTDEERGGVVAHLADCARCRQEVARYRTVTDIFPLSISDAPAPSFDLKDRILREAARTEQIRPVLASPAVIAPVPISIRPTGRRRTGLYGWLVAAALFLVVLGFGARNVSLNRQLQAALRPTTLQGELLATTSAPGADGRYTLDRNRAGLISVVNLPPPSAGQVYEAWVIDANGPKPAGTFVTTPSGQGTIELTLPAAPGTTIAITNEPSPGTPAPTGTILLKAQLA